jgi:hypothetical protein
MKTLRTATLFAVFVGVAAGSVLTAFGQFRDPTVRDAGSKMRDEAITGHEYRAYQRYAQEKAQTLYHRYSYTPAQPQPQVPHQPLVSPQRAKEIAGEIRKDLKTSDAALARLKTAHAKEPEVVKVIDSIEKHHAKAHEVCGMLEEECIKEHGDHNVCTQCCADMWHELDLAKADTDKLFKMLKIESLDAPKKMEAKKDGSRK